MKVNFGSVDISPIEECVMGCGDYREPTNDCRDKLEANYVIFYNQVDKVILISFDLLYIGAQFRDEICNSLSDFFSEDQIFLAASHTHYAPMVDESKKTMGEVNQNYSQRIISQIVLSVRKSLTEDPTEVEIKHQEYCLSQAVNRRRRRLIGAKNNRIHFNKYVMLPNFQINNFPKAHQILLEANGIPLAVLWQFSCHPTSLPSGRAHSAHFVGEIRKQLRREINRDIPLIFFQGFSGDLRPPAINSQPRTPLKLLEKWIVGTRFRLFTEEEYEIWCESISKDFLLNFRNLRKKVKVEGNGDSSELTYSRFTWPLDHFFTPGSVTSRIFSIHKIVLNNLVILGASAELISKWETRFVDLEGANTIIGVSCIDDTFGYLPDRETIFEGGYEAGEYCDSFGLPQLSTKCEDIFVEKLKLVIEND